jgi:hypothetical protein
VKLQFKKRRLIPVALAILVLVVGSGVAYAYWTSTGSGAGTGTTAAGVTNLTATVATPLTAMYPGDTAQTISIDIHNPSTTETVHVTSVAASVTSTSNGGCTSADFTVTGSPATVNQNIVALGDITVAGPQIQFNNTAGNQDACKSVTVNLSFTIS